MENHLYLQPCNLQVARTEKIDGRSYTFEGTVGYGAADSHAVLTCFDEF